MTIRLPRWSALLLLAGVLVLLIVAFATVPGLLYPPLSAEDLRDITDQRARIELRQAQARLGSDARSAALQLLAGALLAVGALATWRQVRISREGQITDRLTRAVDQLGSDSIHVQVGGIYALERIAKDSAADRDSIQFLLGSFIRTRAALPADALVGPDDPTAPVDLGVQWMRFRAPEIQAAIGVLGRRPATPDAPPVYLSRLDLRSVALRGGHFSGGSFRHTNLARAVLTDVHLERGDLTAADLRQARLVGARLTEANLSRAYLQGADLRGADLRLADLRGADLSGAILDGAVLAGARADATTIWPVTFGERRRRELGVVDERPDRG